MIMLTIKKLEGNFSEMNRQKLLNLIGLSLRAGKMISGEELTLRDVRNQKAKLVFVAKNASENTKKKMTDKCAFYHVPYNLDFTQEEISQAIGRNRMIVGICDEGFAKKMQELSVE